MTHLAWGRVRPAGSGPSFDLRDRRGGRDWSAWSSGRRSGGLHRVEGLSIREISRRTGLHRKTVRRALAAAVPPKYSRPAAGSKLDPFRTGSASSCGRIRRIQSQRLRELAAELGYAGGKSIFDDYVREVRPRFLVPRTFQRTVYRPGRACPVRSVGARRAGPGRSRSATSRLGGDLRGVLVAGDRGHADLQQGGAGHPLGPGPQPGAARGAAGEAGLGPGGRDRRRAAARPRRSPRSAASSRSAG